MDKLKNDIDILLGRNKPTYHDIYFAVSRIHGGIIINTDDTLIDSDFFDGELLSDNITDEKTIPTQFGLYKAKLKIHSFQSNIPIDPVEYDCIITLEDVVLVNDCSL